MAEAPKPAQAPTDGAAPPLLTTPPAADAPPADGTKPPAAPPAGDGKPAEKPAGKDDQAPPAPKAPEKYSLVIPKGAETFVDQADLDEWAKAAKAQDWTNDEAQAALEARADELGAQLTRFRVETENDPTYGKDRLEANQQLAKKVIAKFRPADHPRTERFMRFLNKTGAANYVEMFAFLADIGKQMAEDTPARPGGPAPTTTLSAAEKLYGPEKTE